MPLSLSLCAYSVLFHISYTQVLPQKQIGVWSLPHWRPPPSQHPNPGAMCSIPQSWAKLLIRLGSQWIVWLGRSKEFWLKSRRNLPPHTTLLIHSLSFVIFGFECAAIGFGVSGFLAIIADSDVLRLAPTSLICRRLRRTSSSIVRSVSRTLYYVRFVCRVFCKRLPPSCFGQDCTRDFPVLHDDGRSITHGCDESFPWRGETTHEQHCSQFILDCRPVSWDLGA